MRSVFTPLRISATVSKAPAFWPCVWSPVWSTKAGAGRSALTRSTTCWSVATGSPLACPLKPMWVSLIWTKLKLPAAASAASADETRRDDTTPLVETQRSPEPAQAMHSRNPRRSIRSMSVSLSVDGLLHDHGGLHVWMQRTEVLVSARMGERLRERILVAEPGGAEGAGRGRDRMRLRTVIGPRHRRAHRYRERRRLECELFDAHGHRARRRGVGSHQGDQGEPRKDQTPHP